MDEFRIISSDGHVIEPPDVWTTRLETKFRDRAPRIVGEEEGDWWYCGDERMVSLHIGAEAGTRFESGEVQWKHKWEKNRWENVRAGGYIPSEHVKDMDQEGVYGGVIYPTFGLLLFSRIQESELLTALFAAYNSWLADFCNAYPDRLKGIAVINLDDMGNATDELIQAKKMGLAGAMIAVYPSSDRPYNLPEYDPFWAAAEDLGMPLSLHVASARPSPGHERPEHDLEFKVNQDHWVRKSLAHIIYSGVLERYPKLMIGTVEHELAWIPHFLERLDFWHKTSYRGTDWKAFKENMLPSDFFHRNVFCSFQEDALGIALRSIIGVNNLLWGWDYPHQVSTFPRTKEILEKLFDGVPEDDRQRILGDNTAKLYGF